MWSGPRWPRMTVNTSRPKQLFCHIATRCHSPQNHDLNHQWNFITLQTAKNGESLAWNIVHDRPRWRSLRASGNVKVLTQHKIRWSLLGLSATSDFCMKPTFRGPWDQIPDDVRDSLRNVGFIQTPNTADSPRRLHRIQSPREFQIMRAYNQKFPDWPPGERTANGTALCH
jgi:hypothetical protein